MLALCCSASLQVFGQTPPPAVQEDEEIIRISSNLVQTDFIVIDKKGNQVRDLKASNIEIFQDGKLQEITNFAYIDAPAAVFAEKQKPEKNAPAAPPVPDFKRAGQTPGRLITFVLDDGSCNASHFGVAAATDSLERFIKEQMQPSDRVGIYQTRGGNNLLVQYTSNKDQLLRQVKKIKYFPPVFACTSVFDSTTGDFSIRNSDRGKEPSPNRIDRSATGSDRKPGADKDDFNVNNRVVGTLGVLNFIVERLKPIAGRKLVFFLSEGLEMPVGSRAADAMRSIVDNAGRSSVVFNTIDSRGLIAPGSTAADDIARDIGTQTKKIVDTQYGLKYLANETGGSYYLNQNKLARGIREILEDQSGYYLLGYQPDSGTFKNRDFHKIEIKVNDPELKVVYRSGFYGVEDKPRKTKQKTADSPLYQAISAPIQENGIEARLTTLFLNDAKKGNFVRALLYLNGQDLTLIDEASGTKKLSIDVVAVTLDEKSRVVSEFNRTHIIHLPPEAIPVVRQNGFIYTTDVTVEKSGGYSFRIVVRDNASSRLASASEFIEVPDPKKEKFFVSGLITAGYGSNGAPAFPSATSAEEAISPILSNNNAAVRSFRAGDTLFYSYTVYNAPTDSAKKTHLTARLLLYRDGVLVVEGKEKPIGTFGQADVSRIYEKTSIGITPGVEPGEYVLQIIVKDSLSSKTASQWIDFEVVR